MLKIVRLVSAFALAATLFTAVSANESVAPRAVAASRPATAKAVAVSKALSKIKVTKRCRTKGVVLCIDKTRDKLYYVKKGKVVRSMDARFGCAATRTREGTFHVYRKNRYWTSTLYHSQMPWAMFFSGGQAVHYSSDFAARGYYGCSHGCVNIRNRAGIAWVFAHTKVGTKVVVYRS